MSANPLALSLSELPEIAERLASGQKFTCYEHAGNSYRGWMLAIGPIGEHLPLAAHLDYRIANLIVDVLRYAAGQEPLLSRAFDPEDQAS